MKTSENLIIFDTTLRDGAQACEKQIKTEEGVDIVQALEKAGVNVAELPMASSRTNRRMIESIAKATSKIELAAFVRDGVKSDIEEAAGILNDPIKEGRVRIAMLTPTAECLREAGNVSKEEAMRRMRSGIENAANEFISRGQSPNIQIYFEGASEVQDLDFMDELTIEALRRAKECTPEEYQSGIRLTLDYPDTHGTAGEDFKKWNAYGKLHKRYRRLSDKTSRELGLPDVITAAHCHNDGCQATANSILAYINGARQIDGTILGVGERSGNTDLIEVVYKMMRTNREKLITVLPEELTNLAKVASPIFEVNHFRHPIVGSETGSTSAGIHAHKIRRNLESYVKKDPSKVGAPNFMFKVGPAMGKSGVGGVLEEMGVYLPESAYETIYRNYMESLDKGEDENYRGVSGRKRFIEKFIYESPETVRQAEIENGRLIHLGDFDPKSRAPKKPGQKRMTHLNFSYWLNGEEKTGSGSSEGGSLPIVKRAVTEAIGLSLKLGKWITYNTSESSDSEVVAKVTMICKETGIERTGFSIDGDEKIASVQAMLHAISSFPKSLALLKKEEKD